VDLSCSTVASVRRLALLKASDAFVNSVAKPGYQHVVLGDFRFNYVEHYRSLLAAWTTGCGAKRCTAIGTIHSSVEHPGIRMNEELRPERLSVSDRSAIPFKSVISGWPVERRRD
jgi:hypothetical protein